MSLWVLVVCLPLVFVLCLHLYCVCIFVSFFPRVRVYCICAFIFVSQSLDAWPSVPKCPCVLYLCLCMYVCLYVNTNVCSPHSCICTFQIMTAHLGVFADASRQTIRSHLHTPTKANTHERTYSVQTHSHTRLIIISSCYSVTLPPLLLLTS